MASPLLVTSQKRTHPRFSALSPAMLVTGDGVARHCLVENLSSSGALVTGHMQLAFGERVRLLLQLPGRAPFSLGGHIVRAAARDAAYGAQVFGLAFEPQAQGPVAHPAAAASLSEAVRHTAHELARQAHARASLSLVVTDSARLATTLVHDLMHIGRQAIAVTTALDGIEWLLDHSSHFDTAFVDVRCARGESVDFLSFLTDEYPEVRRVVLGDCTSTPKNQLAESHDVLPTPWQLEQLADIFCPAR